MTFAEVYAAWKTEYSKKVKPNSFSTYVFLIEKHFLPYLAEKGPITEDDVNMIHETIIAGGSKEKTVQECIRLLMRILRFAGEKGWWPKPTWEMSYKPIKPKGTFRLMSKKEQRAILNYIRTERTPRNVGFYIAMTTGVTLGELCNLTWQDIDVKNKVLHIRGSIIVYTEIGQEGEANKWTLSQDPESSNRDIPLAPEQLEFLGAEEGRHLPEVFIMSNAIEPSSPRVVRFSFNTLCEKLNITGVQYKDLRHNFAVCCLQSGCDYASLALLLGTTHLTRLCSLYDKYAIKSPRKYMGLMMADLVNGKN